MILVYATYDFLWIALLHGATSQKNIILIFTSMRTSVLSVVFNFAYLSFACCLSLTQFRAVFFHVNSHPSAWKLIPQLCWQYISFDTGGQILTMDYGHLKLKKQDARPAFPVLPTSQQCSLPGVKVNIQHLYTAPLSDLSVVVDVYNLYSYEVHCTWSIYLDNFPVCIFENHILLYQFIMYAWIWEWS
jgi:hypothetical protein